MRYEGTAKLDKKTKTLVKRLTPHDIPIIDHVDMDRVSAETLIASGVKVVVNAAESISGAYPNIGPKLLLEGGVALVDHVGPEIFDAVREGQTVVVEDGVISCNGKAIACGEVLTPERIRAMMDEASTRIGAQIDAFARNTIEYLEKEKDILTDELEVPAVRTSFDGRQVLVVVRGYDFREDLTTLRPYIKEMKPVLIGVDGGADALRDVGFEPDIIIGDMDSVTDDALKSDAELVVHAYTDGRAPALERLEKLGVADRALVWPLAATSEDLALLLAWEKGADLIVAVGTHTTLLEYLDKGRHGMASSFLVRLKVGTKLVDAKGVSKLYRSSVSPSHIFPLIFAALLVVVMIFAISPALRGSLSLLILRLRLVLGL